MHSYFCDATVPIKIPIIWSCDFGWLLICIISRFSKMILCTFNFEDVILQRIILFRNLFVSVASQFKYSS